MTEYPEPGGLVVLSVAGVDGAVIAEIVRFSERAFILVHMCGPEWERTRKPQPVNCRSFKQAVYHLSVVLGEYYRRDVWRARV